MLNIESKSQMVVQSTFRNKANPVLDNKGNLTYLEGVFSDITGKGTRKF